MDSYDVKRLALVLAIEAEIQGMIALNKYRSARGETIAYDDVNFFLQAEELRDLAAKHNDQL